MKLLHRLLAPLLALCFALTSAPVGALPAARTAAILSGVQGWSFPGSSADLYFARNGGSCAVNRLLKPCASLLTTVRASTGYAQWADGHLSLFAANVPRITDLGLLVEQAATNLALNSNDLTQATSWTLNNTTASSNQVTGPDGATSGGSLADNSTNGSHNAFASFTAVSGTTYTSSIYLKAGTATVAQLTFASGQFSGAGYANCNLSNGTVSSTGGTLVASGIVAAANGFYRCWIAATATASAVANASVILTNNNASATRSPSYAGSGQALNTFGDQIEASAFPTSYIPTTTVSVTRAADAITLTNGTFPSTISVFASAVLSTTAGGTTLVGWGTTSPNRASIENSTLSPVYSNDSAGFNQVAAGAWAVGTLGKMAARNLSGDYAVAFNGGAVAKSALTGGPSPITKVSLGFHVDAGLALNGYLRRVAIFKSALSDAQLQAITQ